MLIFSAFREKYEGACADTKIQAVNDYEEIYKNAKKKQDEISAILDRFKKRKRFNSYPLIGSSSQYDHNVNVM